MPEQLLQSLNGKKIPVISFFLAFFQLLVWLPSESQPRRNNYDHEITVTMWLTNITPWVFAGLQSTMQIVHIKPAALG